MYALVMLLVAAGYLLYRRVVEGPRVLDTVLLAVTVGALLCPHYCSAYLLAVVGVALRVHWLRAPVERRPIGAGIVPCGAGLVSFLHWSPAFRHQAATPRMPSGSPHRPTTPRTPTHTDHRGSHTGAPTSWWPAGSLCSSTGGGRPRSGGQRER